MEEKQITLQIDGHFITVPEGSTILEAACKIGINIPTLCHIDLKGTCIKNNPASCRICVVEVAGRRNLAPACATRCTEGMVVKTSTLRVMSARKVVAELILSDHPNDCLTCPKCGNCELQTLALRFNIREMPFNGGELSPRKREVTSSIVRNMDKCIFCRRCESVCNDVQTVGALGAIRRGFNTTIAPAFDRMMKDSECTYCGQCVAVCPVGALTERDYTNRLLDDLADPDKIVIVQTAPAVRAALGEEFGLPPGTLVTGKMVYALRELGFDYVFDTDFAADVVIMEEGTELLDRIRNGGALPMFTSCCPGWINYAEKHCPDILPRLSSTRSPQAVFGALAKTYLPEKMGMAPQRIRVISIMPCIAKKDEAARAELASGGIPDVDVVITVREFARLLRRMGVDLASIEPEPFDNPFMSASTGAAVIFGSTGGVMEAAVRTVYAVLNGKEMESIESAPLRGMDGVREADIDLGPGNGSIRVAICHGLRNARRLAEEALAGTSPYTFIEVMACPGGCVDGGGTSRVKGDYHPCAVKRQQGLYAIDRAMPRRQSHNNPQVKKLYEDFLGAPNSHKAHELLHTGYADRRREPSESILANKERLTLTD